MLSVQKSNSKRVLALTLIFAIAISVFSMSFSYADTGTTPEQETETGTPEQEMNKILAQSDEVDTTEFAWLYKILAVFVKLLRTAGTGALMVVFVFNVVKSSFLAQSGDEREKREIWKNVKANAVFFVGGIMAFGITTLILRMIPEI